jgi:chemotaxis protein methyltransferase CheR
MMHHNLSDTLLSQLSAFVAAQMGLHFPRARWRDLERGIGAAAREFGFHDAASCTQWLVSSPLTQSQIATLASHLTVGETYFFREPKTFARLEARILPELLHCQRGSEQRLRIWSAGCCTGEEPYSVAILLRQMIPDLQDWHIMILATDIHPRFLQKAAEGVYNEWSFRDIPRWIKERYFTSTKGGGWAILPHIKQMVMFSSLNLAEDTYPSLLNNTNAMDIIFCRNVLMYFSPEKAKEVIHKLYRSLVPGGWLLVSPSETSHMLFAQFETVNFPDVILYKKPQIGAPETGRVGEWELSLPGAPLGGIADASFPAAEEQPKIEASRATPYPGAAKLYEQGHAAEAAEPLGAWRSQISADAQALAQLARVYANQGQLAVALAWCEKAVAADKLNPGYHYLLATILQERGQIAEAMQSLKRALYLDQHFVLAHLALGTLTQRQGLLKESHKHFANALALLSAYGQDEILPESEGMTAGRLREIIRSTGG